ncbi:L,D-transpeptidase [Roseibium aggregatum]|uniref:L,D-transpeptidase n=1 Tax=Roseibium aggregatum TaxID=187304 RepID=A0A926P5R8_9HYPH|nr:L,D-transpeptidase [Roseibium aggregatum]MBD1547997.1 L,D-transpeptidase [Roseibium aggregatum]
MRIALVFSAVLVLFVSLVPSVSDAAELVGFQNRGFRPGTIVIKNSEKRLYLVLGGGRAIRYKVAVGKRGKVWTGQTYIDGKYVKPAWSPSAEVHRDHPSLPDVIAGGAPNNPMGVAALTLNGGKYAIHGTNRPGSIGRAVSYGCIRMANSDITDLFQRVGLRTPVIAVP